MVRPPLVDPLVPAPWRPGVPILLFCAGCAVTVGDGLPTASEDAAPRVEAGRRTESGADGIAATRAQDLTVTIDLGN